MMAREEAFEARVPRPEAARRTRIVCVGGGTGLPIVLKGLARWARATEQNPGVDITAVVAMSDDGGSSGRLRRERGLPPPGDVRNCILALAGEGAVLKDVFRYRFTGARGVGGHALGNLVLAAVTELKGDFLEAVRLSERMLDARGHVLPSTLVPVELVAQTESAGRIVGERAIARARNRVRTVELSPRSPLPCDGVLEALEEADLIAIAPGSLYSSVIPNLLVEGVARTLKASRAPKVLVANLMTEPGETDGMSCADHLQAIVSHAGPVVDAVLVHGRPLPAAMLERYAGLGSREATVEVRELIDAGVVPIEADVLAEGKHARHDGRKVARCLLHLARVGW
jgi:uncharacterized cofD-like protein